MITEDFVEYERSNSSDSPGSTVPLYKVKKVKKLVPAKWDVKFQWAQVYILNAKKNIGAEQMQSKQLMSWINQQSLRSLEKNEHYFEKSPSVDRYLSQSRLEKKAMSSKNEFLERKLKLI